MKLKNEEKRWLLKGLGYLGAFSAFGFLGINLFGVFVGLAVWGGAYLLVDRFGLGKENDGT